MVGCLVVVFLNAKPEKKIVVIRYRFLESQKNKIANVPDLSFGNLQILNVLEQVTLFLIYQR